MQRTGRRRISIRASEINTDKERDTPAGSKIIDKCVFSLDLEVAEIKVTLRS